MKKEISKFSTYATTGETSNPRLYQLRISTGNWQPGKHTVVRVKMEGLKDTNWLVDSGSSITLVKEGQLEDKAQKLRLDTNKINIVGIGNEQFESLYAIKIKHFGLDNTIHVFPNSFGIPYDGIIGTDFLLKHGFEWNTQENKLKIGPRTFELINYIVEEDKTEIGVVSSENNLLAITNLKKNGEPILPESLKNGKILYIRPWNKVMEECYKIQVINQIDQINASKERLELLEENTHLNHIKDGREEIWEILKQYHNAFTLPGDPLPLTKLTEHIIHTLDDVPINVKQYRYPPCHKEEISSQIKEMLDKEIIRESIVLTTVPYGLYQKRKTPLAKSNGVL